MENFRRRNTPVSPNSRVPLTQEERQRVTRIGMIAGVGMGWLLGDGEIAGAACFGLGVAGSVYLTEKGWLADENGQTPFGLGDHSKGDHGNTGTKT